MRLTTAAIAALGGTTASVRRGDDVVVEPDIRSGHHGPDDAAATSPDIVAADSFAAALLDRSGADTPYVQAAHDMGLGEIDPDKVDVRRVAG